MNIGQSLCFLGGKASPACPLNVAIQQNRPENAVSALLPNPLLEVSGGELLIDRIF